MARSVLVTGGAGFIGSHLVQRLKRDGEQIVVLDNLSSGVRENLPSNTKENVIKFIRGDCTSLRDVLLALEGCKVVYHLAANPEVSRTPSQTHRDFKMNILATRTLLEGLRRTKRVEQLIFTSSSTVYGDASVLPTPESYAPLKPISLYGASKLACEGLVSAYSSLFQFRAVILRLANVVGPGGHRGIVFDFLRKLSTNLKGLEVLGDGTQTKSYLHVEDCVEGIMVSGDRARNPVEIYNLASEDAVDVLSIASIVARTLGRRNIKYRLMLSTEGGRGWPGDVKNMQLDISAIKSLGWRPRYNSAEAIKRASRELLSQVERRV